MNTRDLLLEEVEHFKRRTGLSDAAIGLGAMNDHKLLKRLRAGGSITIDSLDKVYRFIRKHDAEMWHLSDD